MKRSALPVLAILIAALTVDALRLVAQESQPRPQPRVIAISAKRFEFTPNLITLVRGQSVTFRVSAEDREHGFYQKDLGIELDLSPDHVAEVTITPQTAGHFVAICDHFCGSGHGNMKMVINVE